MPAPAAVLRQVPAAPADARQRMVKGFSKKSGVLLDWSLYVTEMFEP